LVSWSFFLKENIENLHTMFTGGWCNINTRINVLNFLSNNQAKRKRYYIFFLNKTVVSINYLALKPNKRVSCRQNMAKVER